jgi:hypothetical protein
MTVDNDPPSEGRVALKIAERPSQDLSGLLKDKENGRPTREILCDVVFESLRVQLGLINRGRFRIQMLMFDNDN